MLATGDAVIYHDEHGTAHNALLTVVWGSGVDKDNKVFYDDTACVNLVFVSGDDSKQDGYGRQTERRSSVVHVSKTAVHGNYWRKADEAARPYSAPASV